MSRFRSQIKRYIMNNETRIGNLLFATAFAAIFCLCSCSVKQHNPETELQPQVVEFSASAQATWVKSATTSSDLSNCYNDFGVWGVARKDGDIYSLWGNEALEEVNINDRTGFNEPKDYAYWYKDYTYNFIALAPFSLIGGEVSDLDFVPVEESDADNPVDMISFVYNISPRYQQGDYDFDLLAAAAREFNPVSGRKDSQELIFWHLLSQINMTIQFGKDAENNDIKGTLDAIHLSSLPKALYTVSFNNVVANPTAPTLVTCAPDARASKQKISIEFDDSPESATLGPINVIPQQASSLILEIDFTINEGTKDNPILVSYTGFTRDLSIPGKLEEYTVNGKYNYTITIGSKSGITFDVIVNDWDTPMSPEINM